jgi:hypothetical protein
MCEQSLNSPSSTFATVGTFNFTHNITDSEFLHKGNTKLLPSLVRNTMKKVLGRQGDYRRENIKMDFTNTYSKDVKLTEIAQNHVQQHPLELVLNYAG